MIYFSNTRSDPQAYSHTVVRIMHTCEPAWEQALANAYAHFIYGIPTLENASTVFLGNKLKIMSKEKTKN